jgi:hypothetical protein
MEQLIYNLLERISKLFEQVLRMKIFIYFFSNGTCVSSEKAQIVANIKNNRVSVYWTTEQGKMI